MEEQKLVNDAVTSADESKNVSETSDAAATSHVTAEEPILKVEHLKKYFPIKTNFFGKPIKFLKAVDDISFDLQPGKTIGVVGESGCGKTTLGRTILKLYESDGGKIYFMGDDITKLKKRQMMKYRTDIQLIFQDPYSSLPPRMTVGSIIAEPVRVHKIVPKNEVYGYVLDIMKKCGLKPSYYDRYPHEFSGGQRQRICIARALAVKPKLVICDEPVSALDVSIQAQIINLLKDLQKSIGLTYVFISHDLSVVKYITDNILVMYLGNAMEMSETEELFDNPLHPYTQALFSAVPAPNPSAKMNRIVLEGDIPSPANPPAGCKFHTRCSKCMKVCKFMDPEYTEVKPDHFVACHLYNEKIMSNLEQYDAEYDRIEEEKRRAAELAAQKKRGYKPPLEEPRESVEQKPDTPVPDHTEEEIPVTPADDTENEKLAVNAETAAVVSETPTEQKPPTAAEPEELPKEELATEDKAEESAVQTDAAEQPADDPEPKKTSEETEEKEKSTAKKTTATAKKSTSAKTTATAAKTSTAKKSAATTTKAATTKKTVSKSSMAKKPESETENAEEKKPTAKKSTATKTTATAKKSTSANTTATAAKTSTAKKSGTAKSDATTAKKSAAKSSANKSTAAKKSTAKKPTAEPTEKVEESNGEDKS